MLYKLLPIVSSNNALIEVVYSPYLYIIYTKFELMAAGGIFCWEGARLSKIGCGPLKLWQPRLKS